MLTPKTGKHAWHKVAKNPHDWDEVAQIISEVMMRGVEEKIINTTIDNLFEKKLIIRKATIIVRYVKNPGIKISNAWVQ